MTSAGDRADEVGHKVSRVRELLRRNDLGGVLLTRPGSVSWITAGAENPIIRGSDAGAFCWVLVTEDRVLVITQNIEGPRLQEEVGLSDVGFEVVQHPWYAPDLWASSATDLAGSALGVDAGPLGVDLSADLIRLRLHLSAAEQDRFRALGHDAASAVETALSTLRGGDSERRVAAAVASECELRGIVPSVLLVGSDDRMRRFRHCPPTGATIQREAMVVIVGVRGGLNIACTRMASVGATDAELARRQHAACAVEVEMIAATRPGATYGEALQAGIDAYERLGWPSEHEHHYQGGPIGYDVREFGPAPLSQPDVWTGEPVPVGSAVAWNPTVRGGKSEDTYIVGESENELITPALSWPTREVVVDGATYSRAGILEV